MSNKEIKKNVVFVDPSPNMEQIIPALMALGRNCFKVHTQDIKVPDTLFVNIDGRFTNLMEKEWKSNADSSVWSLKKPIFTAFHNRHVRDKLKEISPVLGGNTFQDYILLTNTVYKSVSSKTDDSNKFKTFEELQVTYSDSIIVTSQIPGGKTNISRWKTDYDLVESLASDYFIYYNDEGRHEVYRDGDEIVTVSDSKPTVQWLKTLNPSFVRFAFERSGTKTVSMNKKSWVTKGSSKVILLNDYSIQNISVKLPDNWVKAVAKYLNTYK